MRQGYLSTSYLDQKYLLSERSETREIWIDPSNVCWDNLVSFWKHMMIFFSHLSLFYRWKYLENMRKPVKVEHGCWSLSFACDLRSHHVYYAHHVSYVCTPYASNVGDVPEYVYPSHIHAYVRQWGLYHIHDQGEMCFERSTVLHDFSVVRCEKCAYRPISLLTPHPPPPFLQILFLLQLSSFVCKLCNLQRMAPQKVLDKWTSPWQICSSGSRFVTFRN